MVLVTDAGEEVLRAGDCAGFPAGEANGHHIQNRSDRDAAPARGRDTQPRRATRSTIPTSTS